LKDDGIWFVEAMVLVRPLQSPSTRVEEGESGLPPRESRVRSKCDLVLAAAKALKGIVHVAAIDGDAEKGVAGKLGVKGEVNVCFWCTTLPADSQPTPRLSHDQGIWR